MFCCARLMSGFSVDPGSARLFVRIRGKREPGEAWWSYDLASGAPTSRIHPRASLPSPEDFGYIRAARPLPGTSWTVAQWDDGGPGTVEWIVEEQQARAVDPGLGHRQPQAIVALEVAR